MGNGATAGQGASIRAITVENAGMPKPLPGDGARDANLAALLPSDAELRRLPGLLSELGASRGMDKE